MTIQNIKTGESWGEAKSLTLWNAINVKYEEQLDPDDVSLQFQDGEWSLVGWDKYGEPFEPIVLDPATYRVFDEAREAEIIKVIRMEYKRVAYKADSPETDINVRTHYEGGMYSIQVIARALNINLEEKA